MARQIRRCADRGPKSLHILCQFNNIKYHLGNRKKAINYFPNQASYSIFF